MPILREVDPVCWAISDLQELMTWKGPCSVEVLHGLLCRRYDSSVLKFMGTNPYSLAGFLYDLSDEFTVRKNENGDLFVDLAGADSGQSDLLDDEDDGHQPLEKLPLDQEAEDIDHFNDASQLPLMTSWTPPENPKGRLVTQQDAIDFIVGKLLMFKGDQLLRCRHLLRIVKQEAPDLLDVIGPSKKSLEKFLKRYRDMFSFSDRGYISFNEDFQVHFKNDNCIKDTIKIFSNTMCPTITNSLPQENEANENCLDLDQDLINDCCGTNDVPGSPKRFDTSTPITRISYLDTQVKINTSSNIKGTNVASPGPNLSPIPILDSRMTPIFHRGTVLQLPKPWGIIQRGTLFCDYVDFDTVSLCADRETNELWTDLKIGDQVDCLIAPSDLKSFCGFRALKVWKVKPAVGNAQPAGVLDMPIICGYAVVMCCEGDVGYMRWTNGPLCSDSFEDDAPDLLVFHQKYCGLPPNYRLSVHDSVKFSAVPFPKIWDKNKLWNCLRVWPQSLMRPPTLDRCIMGMYDVPMVLESVTADGGRLMSPELHDPIPFTWNVMFFQSLCKFEAQQECIATILESWDSPHDIHCTVIRLLPKGYTASKPSPDILQVSTANGCSAECMQVSPPTSPSLLDTNTPVCSTSPTQEMITGQGFITFTSPHGGVIKATDGAIVIFGPHCALLQGVPVCHSYFGKDTKVNFEAMVGKVIWTATKIWQ